MKKTYKMLSKQGITLKLSDAAQDHLAELGYDPQFGARPLKRVIQKELVNELSKLVLAGDYKEGDTIYVGRAKKGLSFGKTPPKGESKPSNKKKAKPKTSERDKNLKDLKKATKDLKDSIEDVKD